MANNCALCVKPLRTTNVKCSKCNKLFHISCTKGGNHAKLSEETKSSWICHFCHNKQTEKSTSRSPLLATGETATVSLMTPLMSQKLPGSGNGNPAATSIESPTCSPLGSTVGGMDTLSTLTSEIKLLRGDMGDLKSHIKQLSDHLSNCYTRLDEYDARIKTLEKREEEIISLNSTIVDLREQLNSQAQSAIRNELEISGVNEFKNENPLHIIQVMALKFGIAVEEQDIDFATRAGPRRQENKDTDESPTRPLVVRFVRRYKRDEFLKAAKIRRTMTSSDMEIAGPSRNVYFNERLTHGNRQLFRAARLSSKQKGYKFCWHKNGAILIRKQEGYPSIHIRNIEDLERHLGPTTPTPCQSSPSAPLCG